MQESEPVGYNACCMLWILLSDEERPDDNERFIALGGVPAVVEAMGRHRKSRQLQEAGSGAIMALAKRASAPSRCSPRLRSALTSGVRACAGAQASTGSETVQRSASIGTAITDAGGLEALGAALVAHPSCGKIQNNVGLALDHMETPLHPEDKAMVEGALVALDEARRCWPPPA